MDMNANPDSETAQIKNPVRRMLAIARPVWMLLLAGAALGLLQAAAAGAMPWVVRELVDGVFMAGDTAAMLQVLAALGALIILRHALSAAGAAAMGGAHVKFLRTLQSAVFRKILSRPYPFFTSRQSGDMLAALTMDVNSAVLIVMTACGELVRSPMYIAAIFASMLAMDWRLAAFALLAAPLIAFPIAIARSFVKRNSSTMAFERARMFMSAQEALAGIKDVKIYGRESAAAEKFDARSGEYYRRTYRNLLTQAVLAPVPEILGFLALAAGLFIFRDDIGAGGITAGEIAALLVAVAALYQPVASLGTSFARIEAETPSARRVIYYMDLPDGAEIGSEFTERISEIKLESLNFAYEGARPVMKDFDFSAKKGEFVAVAGPSGSGKTTVADVMLGLLSPQSGRVLFNGRNAAEFKPSSIRAQMGAVSQGTVLFDDTIEGNIRVAAPNASDADVATAAQRAGLKDFVSRLPKGLKTWVGERGMLISGGEAQRIALARAALRDASVLILDEATNSLDEETERKILSELKELSKDRIVIFFTHRESVMSAAARVLRIND
jgi:ABC-type multidrug transport system fused ATPase/permease subunit